MTPVICNVYKCGDTIKAANHWCNSIFNCIIGSEGVHAYVPNDYNSWKFNNNKVHYYICEIPPFTPYWIGKPDDIAASKMKIIKKLEI